MAVTATLRQSTQFLTGPVYRTRHEITETTNIPKGVFVFKTSTDNFSHVATPVDMQTYPENKEESITDQLGFYRQNIMERNWPSPTKALEDLDMVKGRLNLLLNEWSKIMNNGIVDRTIHFKVD